VPAAPVAADKGDADARFKQALDLLKQNQPQEAETALTELSKDFPQFSGPLTDLGILYAKSKRVQPAIQAFTRAAVANPQNALAYNWLGILLRESNDYARAEQAYRKALSINPNHAAANLNLGILYDAYLKRPQEALPYYRNYLRLGGQDDLRVLVWIAQIEKPSSPNTAAQSASTTSTPKPQGVPPAAAIPEKKP
jgi:tetratricopeptide (TPR) repeat protein